MFAKPLSSKMLKVLFLIPVSLQIPAARARPHAFPYAAKRADGLGLPPLQEDQAGQHPS